MIRYPVATYNSKKRGKTGLNTVNITFCDKGSVASCRRGIEAGGFNSSQRRRLQGEPGEVREMEAPGCEPGTTTAIEDPEVRNEEAMWTTP